MASDSVSTASRNSVFTVSVDVSEARRQLHLSIGLVAMLAIGIVSAGVALGSHPLAVRLDVAASRAPVTILQAQMKAVGAKQI